MAFITEQEVRDFTTIQQHVDDYLITNALDFAEKKHIRSCIGKELYDDVVTNPAAGENPALIAQIKPALALWVQYEIMPDLHLKETNKGIMQHGSDNAVNASTRDVEYKRNNIKQRADFRTQEVLDFLEENKADYPLFKSSCSEASGCEDFGVHFPDEDNTSKPIWQR